jgi:hypothetical protein
MQGRQEGNFKKGGDVAVLHLQSFTLFQNQLLDVLVLGVTIPLGGVIVLCFLLAWIFSLADSPWPRR